MTKFLPFLTQRLLGRGIVGTNQVGRTRFVLRERKATVAAQPLDIAHLVHRLAEPLHTWAVIGDVELLDLLHIVVCLWEERALHAINERGIQKNVRDGLIRNKNSEQIIHEKKNVRIDGLCLFVL